MSVNVSHNTLGNTVTKVSTPVIMISNTHMKMYFTLKCHFFKIIYDCKKS